MGYTVEYQILLLVLERLRLPGISAPQLDLLMMSLSASKISLVQVIALTVSVKSLDFAKRKRISWELVTDSNVSVISLASVYLCNISHYFVINACWNLTDHLINKYIDLEKK